MNKCRHLVEHEVNGLLYFNLSVGAIIIQEKGVI